MRGLYTGCLLLIAILAISTAYADTSDANATNAVKPGLTVSIDLKDVDVKSAIEAIFRNTGKNYTIDKDISGSIASLSFKDVPFDTALKNLLKTARLAYRIDGDVYLISKRAEPSAIVISQNSDNPPSGPEITVTSSDTTKSEVIIDVIPLNHTSPREILAALRGESYDAIADSGYNNRFGSNGGGYGSGNYGSGSYGSGYGNGNYGGYGNGYGSGSYGGYGNGYGGYNTYNGNQRNQRNYGGYGGYGGGTGYRSW